MSSTSRTPLRRSVVASAVLITAAALSACSSGGSGAGSSASPEVGGLTLAEVQDAGVLIVGTEGTYRPFSFHEGGSGDLTGYDIEVITAVADELGVDVEFEETQWDGIFGGLDAGRFDVIANQVSINEERLEDYDFSTPYTVSPGVLVVAEDTTDITSLEDLEGRTSAQSLTSNWFEVAESYGASVEAVEGWAQAAELLRQGRVDATVNDELTFLDYEQTRGGETGLKIVDETDDASKNAFAFRKGSDDLVEAVDEALADLRAEGTLAEISEKYFGEDVSE
ncbi:amino acid ABC transporter substrate-binding protein [Labedella phragmitis]|uniref:Amino acid ABC transporter substrate-binding protein n=1 Tax=Labedella phragmitis TaxID=2498849 RepID=A0A444PUS7_9MICO|nr:amino acid ABC transporter substrate-binding protein [Labedella phragmitis]RWZ51626.1 amino acid ABC transporter substrate-binding protein [Labedella phragmitis]